MIDVAPAPFSLGGAEVEADRVGFEAPIAALLDEIFRAIWQFNTSQHAIPARLDDCQEVSSENCGDDCEAPKEKAKGAVDFSFHHLESWEGTIRMRMACSLAKSKGCFALLLSVLIRERRDHGSFWLMRRGGFLNDAVEALFGCGGEARGVGGAAINPLGPGASGAEADEGVVPSEGI